jgi:hypothetical protein
MEKEVGNDHLVRPPVRRHRGHLRVKHIGFDCNLVGEELREITMIVAFFPSSFTPFRRLSYNAVDTPRRSLQRR